MKNMEEKYMDRSEVFEEFVLKRCEEILSQNKIYQDFNNTILSMENEFRETLCPEQLKAYNRIEETIIGSIVYAVYCIYIQCLKDAQTCPRWY